MVTALPFASAAIDLDDRWAYDRTRGLAGWEESPSFLPKAIERALSFLDRRGMRATFFVIGRDAARESVIPSLRAIAAAGHELGNHSASHLPWLHHLGRREIEDEIVSAEEAIAAATGFRPAGYRGPGHSLGKHALEVIASRGYLYDASPLASSVAPLARAVYFRQARLDAAARRERSDLGGDWRSAFASNRPRLLRAAGREIVQIPVTTAPGLRVPFHFTYLQMLAAHSSAAATTWLRTALALCAATRNPPSLLLHATDFLGGEDEHGIDYFPAMRSPWRRKVDLVSRGFDLVEKRWQIVPLRRFAEEFVAAR